MKFLLFNQRRGVLMEILQVYEGQAMAANSELARD